MSNPRDTVPNKAHVSRFGQGLLSRYRVIRVFKAGAGTVLSHQSMKDDSEQAIVVRNIVKP